MPDSTQFTMTLWEPPPMQWQGFVKSQNSFFFEKIIFLCYGGPKKCFWTPKTLLGFRKPAKYAKPSYSIVTIVDNDNK